MGGGDVGLRDEFSESDAGEDEEGAGGGTKAEALAGDEEGCDPGKDGLEGQQQRGVGGGQDGLGPALNGEGGGGGEGGGDDQRGDEARSEVDVGDVR